jgi:hypothetical protein
MVVQAPGPLAPDLLTALCAIRGVYIAQSKEWFASLVGYEQGKKYKIAAYDAFAGEKNAAHGICSEDLFRLIERSECCERQICGAARSFQMGMVSVTPRIGTTIQWGEKNPAIMNGPDTVVFDRPFKCTFMCFARPIMHVRHNAFGYIGELFCPFSCNPCNFNFEIIARAPTQALLRSGDGHPPPKISDAITRPGEPWYRLQASCCQFGLWFMPIPFCGCDRITFNIYAYGDVSHTIVLGKLQRVHPGCLNQCIDANVDNFVIEFPESANALQRATLTAAAIFIDFLYFEKEEKEGGALSAAI